MLLVEDWGSGKPTERSAWLREGLCVQGSSQAGASVSATTFSKPFRLCLSATGGHELQSANHVTQPPFPPPTRLSMTRAAPQPRSLRAGEGSHSPTDTHDRARCRAMMQSGLPPLYTSQALACTHTQLPFLVSSRKTVSPLSPVFITGAGREERHRGR